MMKILILANNDVGLYQFRRELIEELLKENIHTDRIEGVKSSGWILMDYNDVIIHVFAKEDRLFYDLERIWRDGKEVDVDSL